MNPLRLVVEKIADRIHAAGDAEARAFGLTVERLPWGHRSIFDPRVAVHLEQRRARALRDGLDPLDRALLNVDEARARQATARRLSAPPAQRHRPARPTPSATVIGR